MTNLARSVYPAAGTPRRLHVLIMQEKSSETIATDLEVMARYLDIQAGERLLELGCGDAQATRELAELHPGLEIVATEVDEVQYRKNLLLRDVPNITFLLGGAQEIALPTASVQYVVMLKSLHHVPGELLAQSFAEVHRVLQPGGLAYLSEPIADGPFNDLLRLFHDETVVRRNAFAAIEAVVAAGMFELVEQIFFSEHRVYEVFAEYKAQTLDVTHTRFDIDEALLARIKAAFAAVADLRGQAVFYAPQRVDLLRRR
jgi:SAM-dependent methyltransferase